MRKHQQQLILELIRTIGQAQSEKQYADCQSGAQAVGNFIERIKGDGTQTVALLEEYCELLFKASKGEIKEKQLRKHLIKIENSANDELKPDKIEIVFLIYKASMSDCLESIYLAAKADSACDAFWVPIPYFTVDAGGSLGTMYYEGVDHYDKNIICTDWQTYDIKARHPDVIFTHYAYDDNVNNASIHPDFYSKRLREHCELLMHVPYFVAPDGIVEDYCAYLPGVLYAHRVIVESEAVRQSYIEHYKNFEKSYDCKGRFGKAEDKFVALGSPKFDKVLNSNSEDYELPADWSRLIHNSDGSRKKVYLYNTHMFAWINSGGAYFEKLQYIFDLFRSRDDVVLWWRPHPNTELNFETKRPGWPDAYKKIVDGYIHGNWGIYDDTPNLHRAIALSDAYIGDGSSLVPLFSVTGKPIMLQNANLVLGEERKDMLLFESCYDDGAYIWFATFWFNGLFKCSKETWVAECLGCFPGEKRDAQRLFSSITECGGKLYFAPMSADKIAVYDMLSGEFDRIELRKVDTRELDKYMEDHKFMHSISVGDYAYLFPLTYPAIVKICAKTCEIEYIDDWVAKAECLRNDHIWLFGTPLVTFNGEIFAPFLCTDAVLSLSSNTSTTQIIPLQTGDVGYISICSDGNNFWLAPIYEQDSGMHIVKWNRESGAIENICLSGYGSIAFDSKLLICFSYLVLKNGKIYALPHYSDTAICIDTATKSIEVIDMFSGEFVNKGLNDAIFYANPCYWMHGDNIYGLGMNSGTIYTCGTDESFQGDVIEMKTADLCEIRRNAIAKEADECSKLNDCFYLDSDFHGIDDFIDMIVSGSRTNEVCERQVELARKASMLNDGETGKRIYEYCKALALR